MKKLCVIFITCLLSACAHYNVEKLNEKEYVLEWYDPLGQAHSAASVLGWKVKAVCPKGYEKNKEWAEAHPQGNFIYYWKVKCR